MVENDETLRQQINESYAQHLKRLREKKDDSMFVEILSLIEASNSKTREIRKLAEQYTRLS